MNSPKTVANGNHAPYCHRGTQIAIEQAVGMPCRLARTSLPGLNPTVGLDTKNMGFVTVNAHNALRRTDPGRHPACSVNTSHSGAVGSHAHAAAHPTGRAYKVHEAFNFVGAAGAANRRLPPNGTVERIQAHQTTRQAGNQSVPDCQQDAPLTQNNVPCGPFSTCTFCRSNSDPGPAPSPELCELWPRGATTSAK